MKISLEQFNKYVEKQLITKRFNKEGDLIIWNYTPTCQFTRAWDEITTQARGLITDLDGNIVGRAFKKFWNLDEHAIRDAPPLQWDRPYTITEKADGSLFIVTTYKDRLVTATRGSFDSDQAEIGRNIIHHKYQGFAFDPSKTYLFEVIAPEIQIVLDYHGMRDIILLAIVDTKTGSEDLALVKDLSDTFPTVKTYPSSTTADELSELIPDDGSSEGLVIRFSDGQRVKWKTSEYQRLHRIITNTNTITIWQYMAVEAIRNELGNDPKLVAQRIRLDLKEVGDMMQQENILETLYDRVPDEWYKFLKTTRRIIGDQFKAIEDGAIGLKVFYQNLEDRKSKALVIKGFDEPYRSIAMNMMNDKPYQHLIWLSVRPKFGKPFIEENEV